MDEKLNDDELSRELRDLKGWERYGDSLVRTFDKGTFRGAVAFIGTLSELAERAEHHPDLEVHLGRVKVILSTHDAGGITQKDVMLARQIQAAAD